MTGAIEHISKGADDMAKPEQPRGPTLEITDVLDMVVAHTGDDIIVLLKAEIGTGKFKFPRAVADKLATSLQRGIYEALKNAGLSLSDHNPSTAGGMAFTSSMTQFRTVPDGSAAELVVTGVGAPPISIRIEAENLPKFRAELDNIHEKMTLARTRKSH
jgi:hypothetical protein